MGLKDLGAPHPLVPRAVVQHLSPDVALVHVQRDRGPAPARAQPLGGLQQRPSDPPAPGRRPHREIRDVELRRAAAGERRRQQRVRHRQAHRGAADGLPVRRAPLPGLRGDVQVHHQQRGHALHPKPRHLLRVALQVRDELPHVGPGSARPEPRLLPADRRAEGAGLARRGLAVSHDVADALLQVRLADAVPGQRRGPRLLESLLDDLRHVQRVGLVRGRAHADLRGGRGGGGGGRGRCVWHRNGDDDGLAEVALAGLGGGAQRLDHQAQVRECEDQHEERGAEVVGEIVGRRVAKWHIGAHSGLRDGAGGGESGSNRGT